MAKSFPQDRFDSIPDELQRVGAHRSVPWRGRRWAALGSAALATALLVGLGVLGLLAINDRINFVMPGSTANAAATSTPTDKLVSIMVLNGTSTDGLAAGVVDRLGAAGWKGNISATNAPQSATVTTVFYADPSNEAAAQGLAAVVNGKTEESTEYADAGSDLVLLLGSDYAEPAQ
jgi:LytR cell envelope-related transcriptional attenuator